MSVDIKTELAKTEESPKELIGPTAQERAAARIFLHRDHGHLTYHKKAFYESLARYLEKKFEFDLCELFTLQKDEVVDFLSLVLVSYNQSSWLRKFFCSYRLSRIVFHYNEICKQLGPVESWISDEDFNKTIVVLQRWRDIDSFDQI